VTNSELITRLGQALAGLLYGLDNPPGRVEVFEDLLRQARAALALLDVPREDPTEELLCVLESLRLDWETAAGTGTPATISLATWGRAKAQLRRHGYEVED
jgi:hypothetical protein